MAVLLNQTLSFLQPIIQGNSLLSVMAGYDNKKFFSTCPVAEWMNFLLARVTKLVAHARLLKSTILIKICDMFVKWILKGRKCDKSTK